jgi:protein gp37
MGDKSKIEWTDASWNPVVGCQVISPGCKNCYAQRQAMRLSLMHPNGPYKQVVRVRDGRALPKWNGRAVEVAERLDQPLRWQRPRRIFVNSMSDLFHHDVSREFIAATLGVMALCGHHTFQLLTKRPARMRELMDSITLEEAIESMADYGVSWGSSGFSKHVMREMTAMGRDTKWDGPFCDMPWLMLGVSVEDQETADERLPDLLGTRAATRFVSYEPALGPVYFPDNSLGCTGHLAETFGNPLIHQIIIGGESGPESRPFDVIWAESVIEQTRNNGCAVYMKQLGAVPMDSRLADIIGPDGKRHYTRPCADAAQMLKDSERTDYETGERTPAKGYSMRAHQLPLKHRKGGDMNEWPEGLRLREIPRVLQQMPGAQ